MNIEKSLIADIKNIVQEARRNAYAAVNFYMVEAYWRIGERIVMEEQKGKRKAEYGEAMIKQLSKKLTAECGKGFSEVNLKSFRKFYLIFQPEQKGHTVCAQFQLPESQSLEKQYAVCTKSLDLENQAIEKRYAVRSLFEPVFGGSPATLRKELTWSHYRLIMRVDNPIARRYYMNEAADHTWSVRTLERNINTLYYERILSSKNKSDALIKAGLLEKQSPADFIKDPYIFEFLGIPEPHSLTEHELEAALIENLKQFLLELGKGFCFVGRQFRVNTESQSFYIDLVFYNHILKCFALFDIKTGKLTHQDIGQMDMYVRMFDDLERCETDNPTIGVILCTSKDQTIVKYSVLNDNDQIFATKYRSCLPTEEELVAEIEREKLAIQKRLESK